MKWSWSAFLKSILAAIANVALGYLVTHVSGSVPAGAASMAAGTLAAHAATSPFSK